MGSGPAVTSDVGAFHRVGHTGKAESPGASFVEPWAYDISSGPVMLLISPTVDDEEIAALDVKEEWS